MPLTWTKWFERDYTVQYWEVLCHASRNLINNFTPNPQGSVVVYRYQPRNAAMLGPAQESREMREELFNHFSTAENSKKFLKEFTKLGETYVKTAKESSSQAAAGNVSKAYENYWLNWVQFTNSLRLTFETNEVFANKTLEFIQNKYNKTKPSVPLEEVLATCLKPSKVAAPVQAGIDAWKVKQNYSEAALEKFRAKYEWFPCMDLQFDPLTSSGAKQMVQQAVAPPEAHVEVDAAKLLKLTAEENEFLQISREFFYVKDLRDEFRRVGIFHSLPLFKLISRELNISYPQTYSLLHGEMLEALKGKEPNVKEASRRFKGNYFLWLNISGKAETQCVAGKEAEEKAREMQINVKEDLTSLNNFKGISAAPGTCRGKVRKVKVAAHLDRVQQGEVLVAVTTNPNYMTAMNLACAIVTDEGGVTSHAAIVARELKKPCVVGAKIATKILNDGDLIEVNGTTGEVRKIE